MLGAASNEGYQSGLNLIIGCNAFLIASLLDDVHVVRESAFRQQPMKIHKHLNRNVRRTDLHS